MSEVYIDSSFDVSSKEERWDLEFYEGENDCKKLQHLLVNFLEGCTTADKVREREALSLDHHIDVVFGDKLYRITISEV
jgi:hypothetical protein